MSDLFSTKVKMLRSLVRVPIEQRRATVEQARAMTRPMALFFSTVTRMEHDVRNAALDSILRDMRDGGVANDACDTSGIPENLVHGIGNGASDNTRQSWAVELQEGSGVI